MHFNNTVYHILLGKGLPGYLDCKEGSKPDAG